MLTVKLLSFTFEFWFKTKIKAIFGKDCPTMPPIGMRSAADPYNLFSIIQEVKPRAQLQHWTLNLLSRLAKLVRETSLQRFLHGEVSEWFASQSTPHAVLRVTCWVGSTQDSQARALWWTNFEGFTPMEGMDGCWRWAIISWNNRKPWQHQTCQ